MPAQIRGTHRYSFRAGEWANIVGVAVLDMPMEKNRPCYVVEFPDGKIDQWVIFDDENRYEFRNVPDEPKIVVEYDHEAEVNKVAELVGHYFWSFANTHTSADNTAEDLTILAHRAAWFLAGMGLLTLPVGE